MPDAPEPGRPASLPDEAVSDITSKHSPSWVAALSGLGLAPPLPPAEARRLRDKLAARYRSWTGCDLMDDLLSDSVNENLTTMFAQAASVRAPSHTGTVSAWTPPNVREPTAEEVGLRWIDGDGDDPGLQLLLCRGNDIVGEAYLVEREGRDMARWHCKTSDRRAFVDDLETGPACVEEARRRLLADYLRDLAHGPARPADGVPA